MTTLSEKLAEAAIELTAECGHRGATTRKIAARAGISESTLFRLHENKNALLAAAFRSLYPDPGAIDWMAALDDDDVAAGFARVFHEWLTALVRYLPAVKLMMQLPGEADFAADPARVFAPYMEQFERYLRNLHAQKRIVQADFAALAKFVFSAFFMQAPSLGSSDPDSAADEETVGGFAWKTALFLDRKLKSGGSGEIAVSSGLRENKPSDIRENNLRVVLKTFMEAERLSAPDLQKTIRLSKTTITKLVSQLLGDGLLVDLGVDDNFDERGRPPSYYRINGEYGYCVVCQFFKAEVKTALTNLKNEIIDVYAVPITPDLTFGESLDIIVDSFHQLLRRRGLGPERALGLCVAAGGPTDKELGRVAYVPRLHNWPKDAPLRKELEQRLPMGLTIIVNNEMNCQALGEQFFGKAYGKDSALVLEAGEKLGSSIIYDNRLLTGAHFIAGEIGHLKLDADSDVQCVCGAYGCFRALVHSDRVAELARLGARNHPDSILAGVENPTIDDVIDAFVAKDRFAFELMDGMARWMGLALSNLILTFDPEIIVLQGVYTRAGPSFLELIRKHVVGDKFPYLGELNLTLEYSALGGWAGIYGGSKLITERVIARYCRQK